MRMPERQQMYIYAVTACVVIIVIALRYLPIVQQFRLLKKTEVAQLDELEIVNQQYRHLERLKLRVHDLEQEIGDYDRKIPRNRQFAALWQEIADIMNEHNLKDQLIQPGVEIQSENLNRIPISIECSGTLTQVFEFFQAFQGLERVIRIERLQLTNDKDFSGVVTMNALANVYYRPIAGDES